MLTNNLSTKDIFPMSDFQRNTKQHLSRLKELGRPEILTVNGKAEAVVMSPDTFEALSEQAYRWETVQMLREAIKESEAGKGIPLDEAFAALRKKHALPAPAT